MPVASPAAVGVARSLDFDGYRPLLRNPDLNTILGRYWPVSLPRGEARWFQTELDVKVLARCHWTGTGAPLMLLVHGLEGSSESAYMKWMARAAIAAGFQVVRLNVRNCGGTERFCPTLYHSGLTSDLRSIINRLDSQKIFLVGFSMGGNQALKLAGEWGAAFPTHVAGVCAISPPIDLALCARRLAEPRNRIYEQRFLWSLGARLRRKARIMPQRFSAEPLARVKSIVDFDDLITAPSFGYKSAWDYYKHASALPYLSEVRLPALLIAARDDPFIPFVSFRLPANPALNLLATDHGGHVSFLSRNSPRFWAARQVIRFCEAQL